MDNLSNNKCIAKNTLMLYIRMLLSMVVSLYTSRVVLDVLGVEDYGIYGVVGGVVAMFSFLNASMAGATSRFLTFEMGRGDEQRLKDTFSSALIIHIGIALVVFILAETVGLWFLCNKLVIPAERMEAAHWVYQLSIIGMAVNVTQVPYNASIIAHEKMDVYAYIELLHVFLKLGIVYMLTIGHYDKLILYASLVLTVNILIAGIYRFYCVKNYEESRFRYFLNMEVLKPMFGFSIWEILGHFGFSFRTQGTNIVLNMFFGVAINSAVGIATTVQNTLVLFTNNVLVAIKPQIIKRYASGQIQEMMSLIYTSIKTNLLIILIISIPTLYCINDILSVWLKEVPEYTSQFCAIMLSCNIITAFSQIIYTGIQATGDLKKTSVVRNVLYISTPIIAYLLFIIGDLSPIYAFIVIFIAQILQALFDLIILSDKIKINSKYILQILVKTLLIVVAISYLINVVARIIDNRLTIFLISFSMSTFMLSVAFYAFVFDGIEREGIAKFFKMIKTKYLKK